MWFSHPAVITSKVHLLVKTRAKSVGEVFFILQNVYYLETGIFPKTKADLLEMTTGADRAILSKVMALGDGAAYEYDELFSSLLNWCSDLLAR